MLYTQHTIHHKFIAPALMILFMLLSVVGFGQSYQDCTGNVSPIFSSWNLDNVVCSGGEIPFTVGYNTTNDIVIAPGEPNVTDAERTFIPSVGLGDDDCDSSDCTTISPIYYSGFKDTIKSVNHIKYVWLDMEHSNAGDLYINISCHYNNNYQKATILNMGHNTSLESKCNPIESEIVHGWSDPRVSYMSSKFGLSDITHQGCDSTNNPPGIGYTYCWSNDTIDNYQYAFGDGIIYRKNGTTTTNLTNNIFNPSDTVNKLNFYHPDQSLIY